MREVMHDMREPVGAAAKSWEGAVVDRPHLCRGGTRPFLQSLGSLLETDKISVGIGGMLNHLFARGWWEFSAIPFSQRAVNTSNKHTNVNASV